MDRAAKYKEDFSKLKRDGNLMLRALQNEHNAEKLQGEEKKQLPDVRQTYQAWYSEALACVKQLVPDRVEDFVSYYKPLRERKSLQSGNYTMHDYLFGRTVLRPDHTYKVPVHAAVSAFYQQLNIIEGLEKRFESTLFDIKTLVHADVLDDELSAAEELNKKGFHRGAGAVAGVVLEAHLSAVCDAHKITSAKSATISPLNDALKKADVIDTVTWRFIQHLGDIRNKCDHKGKEPTKDEVSELVQGVRKISKTVF
ncbi:hypothetical protein RAD16_14775 [Bradyrhizobium sp. 18BD]